MKGKYTEKERIMEIILVNEGRLKLILDGGDMKKYGLTGRTLSHDLAEGRRALRTLFEEIKRKTGVDADGRRTLLEAFPDKAGGAEIFVTLLPVTSAPVLYRFSSLSHLSAAVRCLRTAGEAEEASLYALGGGTYFLVLPAREKAGGEVAYGFLAEFGERTREAWALPYIREYGTCLCEGGALAYVSAHKENFSV